MKEKRLARYGKFVLLLLVCGLAGGVASFTMSVTSSHLSAVVSNLLGFCRRNGPLLIIAVSCILFAGFLLFYLRAKKYLATVQDDDASGKADTAICVAQVFTTAGQISLIILMGLWMRKDQLESLKAFFLNTVLTVVLVLVFNGLEMMTVGLQKKLSPNKKGDPLKFSFDREWIESCDEAEKYVAYAAAFRTFLILKWAFALTLGALLLLQLTFDTGFLPVAVVGFLWLIHTVSYSYFSLKFFRTRLP